MQFFPVSSAGQRPHSSGLKVSISVRKVSLSSGASGQTERWSLEVWDEGVLLSGSPPVTALGAPLLTAAGSAPHTQQRDGAFTLQLWGIWD